MTGLEVGREGDALIIAPIGVRFVTVIAVEFPAVHKWDVRRKMPLMIEAEHIGVANLLTIELKSFLHRCLHDSAVAMAGKAVGTRDQFQRSRTLMFLMTCRTGPVLHHVG